MLAAHGLPVHWGFRTLVLLSSQWVAHAAFLLQLCRPPYLIDSTPKATSFYRSVNTAGILAGHHHAPLHTAAEHVTLDIHHVVSTPTLGFLEFSPR